MNNHALRLVVHAIAFCAQCEAIIRILVICGVEAGVEAALFQKQFSRRCEQRSRTVIDFPEEAEKGRVRILVVLAEIASGSVGKNDAAGFLEGSIRIDELAAHCSDIRLFPENAQERWKPSGFRQSVVIQEKENLAGSFLRPA